MELTPMLARMRKFYMVVGGGVGGVLGVLVFLATWIYCVARFGLVFGIALGWIPGAIVGVVLSLLVTWLWLPLVLLAAFVITAPSWDKAGVVKRATARTTVYAVKGWAKTEAVVRKAATWTRDEARREGLIKP
jgi:hypothetical protein